MDESEVRLKFRTNDFVERCEKLKINVEEAVQDKIEQINAEKRLLLREIQNVNNNNQNLSKELKSEIEKLKNQIKSLNINSLQNETQKVSYSS